MAFPGVLETKQPRHRCAWSCPVGAVGPTVVGDVFSVSCSCCGLALAKEGRFQGKISFSFVKTGPVWWRLPRELVVKFGESKMRLPLPLHAEQDLRGQSGIALWTCH